MVDIDVDYDQTTKTVTLTINKDFDYQLVNTFSEAYQQPAKHYILDMSKVGYLDSSALGMLLSLREHAFAQDADVSIVNMNDVVLEIFRVLNFHKIFKPAYSKSNFRVTWLATPE